MSEQAPQPMPEELQQFKALEARTFENGTNHVYGIDENGKKTHLKGDNVLAAYGYADVDTELASARPHIPEELREFSSIEQKTSKSGAKLVRGVIDGQQVVMAADEVLNAYGYGDRKTEEALLADVPAEELAKPGNFLKTWIDRTKAFVTGAKDRFDEHASDVAERAGQIRATVGEKAVVAKDKIVDKAVDHLSNISEFTAPRIAAVKDGISDKVAARASDAAQFADYLETQKENGEATKLEKALFSVTQAARKSWAVAREKLKGLRDLPAAAGARFTNAIEGAKEQLNDEEKGKKRKLILGGVLGATALVGIYAATKGFNGGLDIDTEALPKPRTGPGDGGLKHAGEVLNVPLQPPNPNVNLDDLTWNVAHKLKPGSEQGLMSQAMQQYSAETGLPVQLQANGMIQVADHVINPSEMHRLNEIMAQLPQ